jgi:pre-mRNA-splicing factor SYF2
LAKQENWASVKEELVQQKRNPKEQARMARQQKKLQKALEKIEAIEQGVDLRREKMLEYSLEETEKWREKMAEKESGKDTGFTDYHQLAFRKYEKQLKEMKPDLPSYYEEKMMNASTGQSSTLDFLRHRPNKDKVSAMVEDLHKQLEVRKKFSKRRKFNEDDDVTYINERNARFNKKVNRAYDDYTEEYRASVERGSAI